MISVLSICHMKWAYQKNINLSRGKMTMIRWRGDKSRQGEEKEEEETTHDNIHRFGGELGFVEQRKEETEGGARFLEEGNGRGKER